MNLNNITPDFSVPPPHMAIKNMNAMVNKSSNINNFIATRPQMPAFSFNKNIPPPTTFNAMPVPQQSQSVQTQPMNFPPQPGFHHQQKQNIFGVGARAPSCNNHNGLPQFSPHLPPPPIQNPPPTMTFSSLSNNMYGTVRVPNVHKMNLNFNTGVGTFSRHASPQQRFSNGQSPNQSRGGWRNGQRGQGNFSNQNNNINNNSNGNIKNNFRHNNNNFNNHNNNNMNNFNNNKRNNHQRNSRGPLKKVIFVKQ